jgi:hypothetical protein
MRIGLDVIAVVGVGVVAVQFEVKMAPKMDGHGCSASAEYSNEVILEGLNGFFGHVALVVIWGD